MSDKRYSWIQFYPRDWLSDMDLRRCSVEARGLWIDMLCGMTQGRDFGRLVDGAGVKLSVKLLADDARISEAECERLLEELRAKNVFGVDADGTIYSRRMVREFEVRERNRTNGSKGGNPRLLKRETRDQRLETKESLTVSVKRVVIPYILKHPQMTQSLSDTWAQWVDFRMKLKAVKDWHTVFGKQVEMLAKHDAATACHILNNSMQNGWQGIFEPRSQTPSAPRRNKGPNI